MKISKFKEAVVKRSIVVKRKRADHFERHGLEIDSTTTVQVVKPTKGEYRFEKKKFRK